jgi:hypothetical protein
MKARKISVTQYIDQHFEPGSRPDRRTVISRIQREEIPGVREGLMYYVLVGAETDPKDDLTRRAIEFLNRQ